MKNKLLRIFYLVIIVILITSCLFNMITCSDKNSSNTFELNVLKLLNEYNQRDLQLKKNSIGIKFNIIPKDKLSAAEYFILFIYGNDSRNSNLTQLIEYYIDEVTKNEINNVSFIFSLPKYEKKLLKSRVNKDIFYNTDKYKYLVSALELTHFQTAILLLDVTGKCLYSFSYFNDDILPAIENSSIVFSLIRNPGDGINQ